MLAEIRFVLFSYMEDSLWQMDQGDLDSTFFCSVDTSNTRCIDDFIAGDRLKNYNTLFFNRFA